MTRDLRAFRALHTANHMGNKGSQPVVESARTVLSRRKMPEAMAEKARAAADAAAAATNATNTVTTPASASSSASTSAAVPTGTPMAPVFVRPAQPSEQSYTDSTILNEMSKWNVVKSTKVPVKHGGYVQQARLLPPHCPTAAPARHPSTPRTTPGLRPWRP